MSVYLGPAGEKRLFYSIERTSESGILDNSAYSNSLTLNSEKAKDVIFKLAKKTDIPGDINLSWQFCESDNECISVKNKCGNSIGVNKKYKDTYLDFLKTTNKYFDCSKKLTPTTLSKCVESFCS